MSGGFFRGTSADQDTRFSNKQAKLLKTQKFAPELDHLVDMTKVKMDVMKPWIATRVTELLGFEDEVLINFIYGLLDEKEVDGKKIQIQLTGFMEKNTVKFMKELWGLLLSAQQNASGVPQQFLDAKEAEIQQKKAEEARIAQEIQKKREKDGRDAELGKHKIMDGDAGNSRFHGDPLGSALNIPSADAEKDKELNFNHSSRAKNREGRRSRSISMSPRGRQQSTSPGRHSPSPSRPSFSYDRQQRSLRRSISPRRSVSPRRHSPISTSVSMRRSSYSRRSSPGSKYCSPSPRQRSHIRRKSPSSGRRRSPSPHRPPVRAPRGSLTPERHKSPGRHRMSPARHWSPSPGRRRPWSPSPGRRRPWSPSPGRRRPRSPSPGRRRPRSPSPGRRRPRSPSPGRRRPRSPSPGRRRPLSRSPGRQWSPSFHPSPQLRSPKRRRRSPVSPKTRSTNCLASLEQRRSNSSYNSKSPNRSRRSLSRDTDKGTNAVSSTKDRDMLQRSQDRRRLHVDGRNDTEMSGHRSPDSEEHRLTKSLRSPNNALRNSTRDSPLKSSGKLPSKESTYSSGDEEGSRARENARKANSSRRKNKDFSVDLQLQKVHAEDLPREKFPSRSQQGAKGIQKKHDNELSETSEDEHDGTRIERQIDSPDGSHQKLQSPSIVGKDNSYSKDGMNNEHVMKGSCDASHVAISAQKYSSKVKNSQSDDENPLETSKKRTHGNSHINSGSSGSEESEKHRSRSEKRRKSHKHKRHYDDSSESDSERDDKECKRRRKEEKRLRKEEKCRRREERHRRRADRHASKQKMKHVDTVALPSDLDKDSDSDSDLDLRKKGSCPGREESDQKKLEIELREKALESLRAKKAINH